MEKPKKQKLKDGLYRICSHCEIMFPIAHQDAKEQLCWDCYRKVMWSSCYLKHHLTAPTYKPEIFPCLDLWDNLITGPCRVAGGEPPILKKVVEDIQVIQQSVGVSKKEDKKLEPSFKMKDCKKCLKKFKPKTARQKLCLNCSKTNKEKSLRNARRKYKAK